MMRLSGHLFFMVAMALTAACDPGTTTFVVVGGDGDGTGDVSSDAGGDAVVPDTGPDAAVDGTAGDSATDATADAGTDADADAGPDTPVDSTSDGSSDASPDSTDAPMPGVCEGVTCSGKGVCNSSTGAAICKCDTGYSTGADPKTCVSGCVPSCGGKTCGSDGCGGSCGSCGSPLICSDAGQCGCPDAPTAVIVVTEGEEVIPQTKLHLVGSQSFAAKGSVATYAWTVQQPVGSVSNFLPHPSVPNPTFEANVAGTYVFRLAVTDSQGEVSCEPAEFTVLVVPDEAIHIELVWNTPGDKDQTDEGPEAGADLDVHFTHAFATGEDVDGDGKPEGWFDKVFDCYWFNAHPNWGQSNVNIDDDPGLDRDDTDGAGPENMNLNLPEGGITYKLGVHYWSDHNFGPSTATVRVYIYSSLTFEAAHVELKNLDMWEVATVKWPSGDVSLITHPGGAHKIIPNYKSFLFPSP